MEQPDVDQIQKQYESMTSEEFKTVKREDLTEIGQQAYAREIQRRSGDAFKEQMTKEDVQATQSSKNKPKKRGLIRLIVGSFFLSAGIMDISVNAHHLSGDTIAEIIVFLILGILLIWLGSHARTGWRKPLGIAFIVLGTLSLISLVNLTQLTEQNKIDFEGTGWLLGGSLTMIGIGIVVLVQSIYENSPGIPRNQKKQEGDSP